MTVNSTNQPLVRPIPYVLHATFEVDPVTSKQPRIDSTVGSTTKPTIKLGSPRTNGQEEFKSFTLSVSVAEEADDTVDGLTYARRLNVLIDALNGEEAVFELNDHFWSRAPGKPFVKRATFDAHMTARCVLTADEVATLFRKGSATSWRVNENLLDFTVTIPALAAATGRDACTESVNRLLVYRRKALVFIPGLLGSTIALKINGKDVPVYPALYLTPKDTVWEWTKVYLEALTGPGDIALYQDYAKRKHIEQLECDEFGQPLLMSKQEIFHLMGELSKNLRAHLPPVAIVYAPERTMREQWLEAKKYSHCPPDFYPFEIIPAPYDWRLDLEDSAQAFFKFMKTKSDELRREGNADDRLAAAGHSTGGVILRRICTLDGVGAILDHAFFMNAPFRGAPKALDVFLFGGAPTPDDNFAPMMPSFLVDAESMVHVSPNLPILYYLAPSKRYPDPVCTLSPTESFGSLYSGGGRETEKAAAGYVAYVMGIYHPTRAVKGQGVSDEDKVRLAAHAREWHETWWKCHRRTAHNALFSPPSTVEKFNRSDCEDTKDYTFQDLKRNRTTSIWNAHIAANAEAFHEKSEQGIDGSPVNLYVFWSNAGHTLGSLEYKLPPALNYARPEDHPGLTVQTWGKPPYGERLRVESFIDNALDYYNRGWFPSETVGPLSTFQFEKWFFDNTSSTAWKFRWSLTQHVVQGDGTVPRASLLGIGTHKAKLMRPIPGDPWHVPAPNSSWLWDRIIDVLTDRGVRQSDIATGPGVDAVNPTNVYMGRIEGGQFHPA